MPLTAKRIVWVKALIHVVSLTFAANMVWLVLNNKFGADPVDGITHYTGLAALNTLIITMLVSPIAKYARQGLLIRCRRVLGLYSFFWATLHLLTYLALDLTFDFSLLGTEILSRPYLTVGAFCWVILFALTVTSTSRIQRKMGVKWQKLHNSVYLVLILAPIHFYWSSKSELLEPSLYFLLGVSLLAIRWKTLKRIVLNPMLKRG
ncbi:sulfoxide reductase heme-binding subunit YedZ [Enterovibrio norvegicus FF-33]|uniref:protein-methionine-sulfoxide reductase heme-binding subunit MsrQ n=1 Tax=Enterovibrio TaxID=188143 RepID=UPI000319C06F|nr:protein-methionine-sulfoxide reductase heme-binding subunit MsrQ [Enterovibrio norvegicus]OEE66987.1 sulfoxide reductase heme-binding subunit YedZ [Enterovibrio norvegicus FF-33]OEE75271.1 sulfoxide reductase heme-binding subunit YedZ [Enterovibrio norvegicus FF-162]